MSDLPKHCLVRGPLSRMEQALRAMSGVRVRRVDTEHGAFVSEKIAQGTDEFLGNHKSARRKTWKRKSL